MHLLAALYPAGCGGRDEQPRLQRTAWFMQCHQELPGLYDFFTALPTTVVVDHMGRPDVSLPVDGPGFELFLKLLREHDNFWSKVSCPERLSLSGPPDYDDVVPFARRVVESFPDRVLWVTVGPYPNMKNHMPDDG